MEVPDVCRAAWDKSHKKILKDSTRRHTKEHRVKTAKQKKLRRERKMGDARKAKVEKDSYKMSGSARYRVNRDVTLEVKVTTVKQFSSSAAR